MKTCATQDTTFLSIRIILLISKCSDKSIKQCILPSIVFFWTICPHKVKILVKTLPQTTLCFIFLGKTMSNGWLKRIGKSNSDKSYVLIVLSLCKTKFTRIAVCWYIIVWLGKNCQRCKCMKLCVFISLYDVQ